MCQDVDKDFPGTVPQATFVSLRSRVSQGSSYFLLIFWKVQSCLYTVRGEHGDGMGE